MLAAPSSETDHDPQAGTDRTPPPRRAGKYNIIAELGRGGTATVYLAVVRGIGGVSKLVVLKALLPEFAEETSAMSSFLDEARLALQLNHPNVVQTYEVGAEEGHTVIVMEYLEGQSLSRITRCCEATNRRLPDGMHLRILIELLAGLHYSHELKSYEGRPLDLVHRDVSPQNVFVTYDGQVKVLDFGIAKARTSLTHTANGVLKGKISYMSSEQMAGGAVDRRADIFAVGCMLWAAAAGRKLWKDYSYVQIVRLVLGGKIPSPKQFNPYCPEDLERIVMKALAPNRDDRYSTALEMQEALEAFTERAGLEVKQREIGAFVSHLFADTRAELKTTIEREVAALRASEATEAAEAGSGTPSERVQFGADEVALASTANSQVREVSVPRPPHRRRGAWMGFVTALAVGLCASFVAYRATRRDTSTSTSPTANVPHVTPPAPDAPEPSPSVAAASPAGPRVVALKLDVVPKDARLVLDGRVLDAGVTELSLPVSESDRTLTAEADGYDSATVSFRVQDEGTLRLVLERDPSVAPKKRAPAAKAKRSRQAGDCGPPSAKDEPGVERIRPECL